MTQPTSPLPTTDTGPPKADPLRLRYRVRFGKTGLLRWTSHRDLARLWERIVRRTGLKPSMTEGFHPKPRIGFPSALALGVEGLDEVVELDLAEDLAVQVLFDRLCSDNQPGLTINSVRLLPEGFGKAQLLRTDYIITIPDSADFAAAEQAIAELKSQDTLSFERKKKTVTVDASQIPTIEIVGQELHLSLAASDSASLRPGDVLDLIGTSHWIEDGALISRTQVILQKEFETDDPQLITSVQSKVLPPPLRPAQHPPMDADPSVDQGTTASDKPEP